MNQLDLLPTVIGATLLREACRDPAAYMAAIDGLRAAGWTFDAGAWTRTPFAPAAPAKTPLASTDAGDDAAGGAAEAGEPPDDG